MERDNECGQGPPLHVSFDKHSIMLAYKTDFNNKVKIKVSQYPKLEEIKASQINQDHFEAKFDDIKTQINDQLDCVY